MGATVSVLGAGSWGTALALQLARNGHQVRLWGHQPEHIEQLRRDGENRHYLPGIPLPDNIHPVDTLAEALAGSALMLVVVPSVGFPDTLAAAKPHLPDDTLLAWATKGLEPSRSRLLHEVMDEAFGERPSAILSGPTFAGEVARDMPSAVTVASRDPQTADRVGAFFHSERFRVYTSDDVIGVQIGGAAKNVLAIAAGTSDGLGFGANARAALITRGLAEIKRLAVALGAQPETLAGLTGVGDAVLTCTDNQSRNRRLGLALARGLSLEQARAEIGQEVEGAVTVRELLVLAGRVGVEMPIAEQVRNILYEGHAPAEAVHRLLTRERTRE